jgi:iron(III) transport system substrate-binding protein
VSTFLTTCLAVVLACCLSGGAAVGFEIEEERLFPAPAGETALVLRILSSTDTVVFAPLIAGFQAVNSDVAVDYTVASTQEVYRALGTDRGAFDLVVSSAMDLQMKLVNDGHAQSHRSGVVQALPDWARWRDQLFAFTQEPIVAVASREALAGLPLPRTRSDLIRLLRDHPDRFEGRIGTYDPARSGAGYLFATQDARQSDTYWRLSEVMGGLSPRLYETSGAMIDDVRSGRLALAYNVLGSYAATNLPDDGDAIILEFEDYTNVLLRTAFVPADAPAPDLGGRFVDFLLSPRGQSLIASETGLPPLSAEALASEPELRPIRLDTGLLVFVDTLKRQRFLQEWQGAMSRF